MLKCSSSEVVTSMFEDLGRVIDKEQGLKKLTVINFFDENALEEWPLHQIVIKSPNLESLTIACLRYTTAANRS